MIGPLRWLRNHRADKAARATMTRDEVAISDAFGIPPRMLAGRGTYANASANDADLRAWAEHVLGPEAETAERRWPTRPGVTPVSVSHDRRCNPWTTFGGCHPECTAPDRRISPLRDDDGRWVL